MSAPLTNTVIDDPSLWRLSLLVGRQGVDVLARRIVGEPSMISASVAFDAAAASVSKAFEDAVYANPLLLSAFSKTDIVISGGFSVVVASEAPAGDIDAVFPSPEPSVTFSSPVDGRSRLLFRIPREMAGFVRRTFEGVEPVHSLSVLARYFVHRSRLGNSAKMYLVMGDTDMDVLIFNQLGLAVASSFRCSDINDAAYYALAAATTAGFDFTSDEIRIAGNTDRRAEITPVLRRFARQVMPAIIPSAAINGDSSALAAPFPLLIIPLCE